MRTKEISDINAVSYMVQDYIKEKEGKFYISDVWDREEAKSYNVDYNVASDFLMRAVNNKNKGEQYV